MYKLFFPNISSESKMKGIALAQPFIEDVTTLDCNWYYNWSLVGNKNLGFIPMSWNGISVPTQTEGYCLFLNEPENKNQSNVTPEAAVYRLGILRTLRPNLKFIVGGCGAIIGAEWLNKFKSLNTVPISGYHIHGYIENGITLKQVVDYWTYIRNDFPGEIWITEFADVLGERLFDLLYEINKLNIQRFAYFTNRVVGNEASSAYPNSWPKPECISLIDQTGKLTSRGKIYKNGVL